VALTHTAAQGVLEYLSHRLKKQTGDGHDSIE